MEERVLTHTTQSKTNNAGAREARARLEHQAAVLCAMTTDIEFEEDEHEEMEEDADAAPRGAGMLTDTSTEGAAGGTQ
eukprot:2993103-Rhodomonas_salina.1